MKIMGLLQMSAFVTAGVFVSKLAGLAQSSVSMSLCMFCTGNFSLHMLPKASASNFKRPCKPQRGWISEVQTPMQKAILI